MKRSGTIALTILAAVTLTACGDETVIEKTQRALYASKDDCVKDWGDDDSCEKDTASSGYYGPHYYYRGGTPYYFHKGGESPVPVGKDKPFSSLKEGTRSPHSIGSTSSYHASVSRGGFGSRSFFHSSGS